MAFPDVASSTTQLKRNPYLFKARQVAFCIEAVPLRAVGLAARRGKTSDAQRADGTMDGADHPSCKSRIKDSSLKGLSFFKKCYLTGAEHARCITPSPVQMIRWHPPSPGEGRKRVIV